MKRGKKYVEAAKTIDRGTLYDVADAVSLVKKTATAKFDETIEAHIRTGCDGRHADQRKGHVLPDVGRYAFQRAGGRERDSFCLLPYHSHCRSPVPQPHDGQAFFE